MSLGAVQGVFCEGLVHVIEDPLPLAVIDEELGLEARAGLRLETDDKESASSENEYGGGSLAENANSVEVSNEESGYVDKAGSSLSAPNEEASEEIASSGDSTSLNIESSNRSEVEDSESHVSEESESEDSEEYRGDGLEGSGEGASKDNNSSPSSTSLHKSNTQSNTSKYTAGYATGSLVVVALFGVAALGVHRSHTSNRRFFYAGVPQANPDEDIKFLYTPI